MSQHDFNIANQGFPAFRADLNEALQALVTNSSGATAPSTTYANQWWYDTTTNILKLRSETNDAWISFAYADQTSNSLRLLDDTQVVNTSGVQTGLIGDQPTATWEAGTGTTQSLVSPANIAAAIAAQTAGGGSGTQTFTATGTIPNGALVGLNADGTVSVLGGYLGDAVQFKSNLTNSDVAAVYDSANGKVVIFYADGSLSAIVGTVSGTSISFGTAVSSGISLFSGSYISAAYDSANGKIVIIFQYSTASTVGQAVVATVSGTSISFGSFSAFSGSSPTSDAKCAYDSTTGKVVIAWADNYATGQAIVGTVSGTSISFGTKVSFSSAFTYSNLIVSIGGKVVISYRDYSNSYGTAIVGTISGTSISFGTKVVFSSVPSVPTSSVYDSGNGKVVIAYGTVTSLAAIVGTVSGTSISFGTPTVIGNFYFNFTAATYDPSKGKVVISLNDTTTSNAFSVVGTVSGTSINFGYRNIFYPTGVDKASTVYVNGKVVLAFRTTATTPAGIARVSEFTGTGANYIGVAAQAISGGASGPVTIVSGVNESQSGLTTGAVYSASTYDGTLVTGDSRPIGYAISPTKLYLNTGRL